MSLGIHNRPFVAQTLQRTTANNGKQEISFGYGRVTHQFFKEGEGFVYRKCAPFVDGARVISKEEGCSSGPLSPKAIKNMLLRCLRGVKNNELNGQYFHAGHNVSNIPFDADLSKVKDGFHLIMDRNLGNVKLLTYSNGTKNLFEMHPEGPLQTHLMDDILQYLDKNNPTLGSTKR